MLSIPQELISLKRKVDKILCLLSNDTGGGIVAETDPTVPAPVKTLTQEDVDNVKGLTTNPYIPLSGYDKPTSKSTPKSLFFSNYDYINNPIETGKYLIEIGPEGYKAVQGVQNNSSDYYEFGVTMENGLKYNQVADYFGIRNINRFQLSRYGADFYYAVLNDSDGYSKSGSMTVNNFGNFSLISTRTSTVGNVTDHSSVNVLPEGGVQMNVYSGATVTSKIFYIGKNNIRTNALVNAIGDATFNKVLVVDQDGVFGMVNKDDVGGNKFPTLYPKVTILSFSEDAVDFILRVNVTNLQTFFFSEPYFEFAVGSIGGVPVYPEDVHTVDYTGNDVSLTEDPRLGGITFTIKFTKSANTNALWRNPNMNITATWIGTDNYDRTAGENGSDYTPARIASDSKPIKDIRPAVRDLFARHSQIRDVSYTSDGVAYYVTGKCIVAGERAVANSGSGLSLKLVSNATGIITGTNITLQQIGSLGILMGTVNDVDGNPVFVCYSTFAFRITIPKATNSSNYFDNQPQWFNFVLSYSGWEKPPIDIGYSIRTIYTPIIQNLDNNIVQMPFIANGDGDATFTRNVIQKADGTLGYEPKRSLPSKRYPYRYYYNGEVIKLNNTIADVIELQLTGGMSVDITSVGTGLDWNDGCYWIMCTQSNAEVINIVVSGNFVLCINRSSGGREFHGYPYSSTPLTLHIGRRYLVSKQIDGVTVPTIVLHEFNTQA